MDTAVRRNNPLLINESPMQFLPSLACVLGEHGALFAQQLHYWLQDNRRPHWIENKPWVYNTLVEWNLQFPFWSKSTLRRTIKNLQNVSLDDEVYHVLLVARFGKTKLDRRCWYTLDYDELDRLVPIATSKLHELQRSLAGESIFVKNNITILARQYPALAPSSITSEQDEEPPESATNPEVFKMNTSKCSKRNPRSVQNEQFEAVNMNSSKCSKRTVPSVQNENPTNITIDYAIDYSNRLTNKRDTTTTTTRGSEKADDGLAEVEAAYANNINPLYSPMEKEMLIDLYDRYKREWMLAAFREAIASASGRPSLKYIAAILDRWQREGFQSSQKGKGVRDEGTRTNRQDQRHPAAKEQSESEAQFERDVRAWEQQPAPFDLPGDVGL